MQLELNGSETELLMDAIRIAGEQKRAALRMAGQVKMPLTARDFGIDQLEALFEKVADAYNAD